MDRQTWLVALGALYVAAEVISNVTAGRLVEVFGLVLPGAAFLYALTFTLRDAFHLVGGFGLAKRLVWVGLFANALLVLYGALVNALPHPAFFHPEPYEAVLSTAFRVVGASLAAYWVSTMADTLLFERWRGSLWGRVAFSNLASTALDSMVFIGLAFGGTGAPLALMVGSQTVVKFATSLLLLPLVYGVRASLRRAVA